MDLSCGPVFWTHIPIFEFTLNRMRNMNHIEGAVLRLQEAGYDDDAVCALVAVAHTDSSETEQLLAWQLSNISREVPSGMALREFRILVSLLYERVPIWRGNDVFGKHVKEGSLDFGGFVNAVADMRAGRSEFVTGRV